jgi:hypothetical protein
MRLRWVNSTENLMNNKDIGLDITELKKNAFSFYSLCILNGHDISLDIKNLVNARRHLETCLTLLKGIIDPKNNQIIDQVNQQVYSYRAFLDYLDNANAVLDAMQGHFFKTTTASTPISATPQYYTLVDSFKEKMLDYMNNLVLMPIHLSYQRFLYTKNIKKDSETYVYLLFREIYSSVEIRGSPSRLKVEMSTGSYGTAFNERVTNIIKTPGYKGADGQNIADTTPPEAEQIQDSERFQDPFLDLEEEDVMV